MVHGQKRFRNKIRPSEKEGILQCSRKPFRVDNGTVKVNNVDVLLKYRSDCNLAVPMVWKSRLIVTDVLIDLSSINELLVN